MSEDMCYNTHRPNKCSHFKFSMANFLKYSKHRKSPHTAEGSFNIQRLHPDNSILVMSGTTCTRYLKGKKFNDLGKGQDITVEGGLNGTRGADFVHLMSDNLTFNAGKGDDYIIATAMNNSKVLGGAAADTIMASDNTHTTLDGGDGNDYILVDNDHGSTIIGGKGNDTIEFSGTVESGTTVSYSAGRGKDTLINYTSEVTIALSGEVEIKKSKVTAKGDTVLTLSNSGQLTFKNYAGQVITVLDSNGNLTKAVYGNGVINITGTEEADLLIGTPTHDSIVGLGGNDSLYGNAGNDTITGGNGSDYFSYTDGDGKDVITDYEAYEVIEINDEEIKSIKTGKGSKKNDIILSIGKGSLTVKDAKGKKMNIIDADGYQSSQMYGDTITTVLDGDGEVINTTLNTTVKTIDASARTYDVELIGNKQGNTIISGTGDDSMSGGSGKDVFVHTAGYDIITDYTSKQDALKFNDSIVSAVESGEDVIFNLETSGTVVVIGGAGSLITVVDKDDSTLSGFWGSSKVTLGNSDGSVYSAIGGITEIDASKRTKAIVLIGNELDNTITGGKKNDTITGGNGADVFIYTQGNGNDMITDYSAAEGDIISLSAGTYITDATVSGSDYELNMNKGKVIVSGGASKRIVLKDSDNNELVFNGAMASFEERWFTEESNYITSTSTTDLNAILEPQTDLTIEYKDSQFKDLFNNKTIALTHNQAKTK